ncbi:MAG: energy transducer TonB [Gammaproteobacteria bacterium]|nr:MAG: energy transducer TonB [Gammaproteobacteria bacterium]
MFSHYLKLACLFIIPSFLNLAYADVYKWVNEDGETSYAQHPPAGIDAKLMSAPPPPAIDPNVAQKKIDTLIEKQDGTYEAKQQERLLAEKEAKKAEERQKYCETSRQNVQQYQNNPGRKMIDSDGNVTKPNEEQRQEKIRELQERIAEHCSK